jgi:hypothetical protein
VIRQQQTMNANFASGGLSKGRKSSEISASNRVKIAKQCSDAQLAENCRCPNSKMQNIPKVRTPPRYVRLSGPTAVAACHDVDRCICISQKTLLVQQVGKVVPCLRARLIREEEDRAAWPPR